MSNRSLKPGFVRYERSRAHIEPAHYDTLDHKLRCQVCQRRAASEGRFRSGSKAAKKAK